MTKIDPILILEGNPRVQQQYRQAFKGNGLLPIFAEDGDDALNLLEVWRNDGKEFAAIVVNDDLRYMDGVEFIESLKGNSRFAPFKGIPLIAHTANPGLVESLQESGADAVLKNPDPTSLVIRVKRAVAAGQNAAPDTNWHNQRNRDDRTPGE